MGDTTPPLPPQSKDIDMLNDMRDLLGDYLATVERNTDAVNHWLSANRHKIILSHQRLDRAIYQKDEAAAAALIASMGDAAGFVLSLQDFRAKSEAAFGKDNKFLKAAASVKDRLPDALQEPLPRIDSFEKYFPFLQQDLPVATEESEKWWDAASGWFNRKEKRKAEQERKLFSQLQTVQAEILGLQSDRHYYIDSFMEWVADSMGANTPDNAALMQQYKNPAHVIALAQADYREAVETRANAVRDAALDYARLAGAIDRQDMRWAMDDRLRKNSEADRQLQAILLEDYQSLSFAEIILNNVKSRTDMARALALFYAGPDSPPLPMIFSNAEAPDAIFEKFFRLTLDRENPLPPAALEGVIKTILREYSRSPEALLFSGGGAKNIFQRAVEQCKDDPSAQKEMLGVLLKGMGGRAAGAEAAVVDVSEGLRLKDAGMLGAAFGAIEKNRMAAEFTPLWQLCYPGISLLDKICGVSSDLAVRAVLLEQAIRSGLLHELKPGMFETFMEKEVLPVMGRFPVSTLRLLLLEGIRRGTPEKLRALLTKASGGWLGAVVASPMDELKKQERIAAFLEPFKSPIVKANILAEAAEALPSGKESAALSRMEWDMIGGNIRLRENEILCNLHRVVNVWYVADTKTLHYAAQGQTQTLLKNVSPQMAAEVLSLVCRRGGFLPEEQGAFRPENVDAIKHGYSATSLCWNRVEAPLNADVPVLAQLQKRADYLHVKDALTEHINSYNLASVCLLEKRADGTSLLIDKHGTAHILDGRITLPSGPPLIDLGDGVRFNPDNASIVCLEPGALEFRIEGADFDKLLDHKSGQVFYRVEGLEAAAVARLKEALGTADFSSMYFNMRTFGYLVMKEGVPDESLSTLSCKRNGRAGLSGVFQLSAERARDILASIERKQGVVRIGNIVLHEDSVDDVYHNVRDNKLQIVVGHQIIEMSVSASEGRDILELFGKSGKFRVIAEHYTGIMPIDAVNIERVTLFSYKPADGKVYAVADNRPFHVPLTGNAALDFFDGIEKEGVGPFRVAMDGILKKFPILDVAPLAAPEAKTPPALLRQALGQPDLPPEAGNKAAPAAAKAGPLKKP